MSAEEFAALFRDSSRVLWLIAVGIVADNSTAEDCLQDAAMIALRKLDQFQPGTSFRAWMGAIVRNVALNALRSDRRRRGTLGEWPRSDAMTLSVQPASERSVELDRGVVQALSTMGDVARACLLLRTVGDLQYSEIAFLLEIPEGTAMSHVHRARARLRKELAPLFDEFPEHLGKERSNPTDE